MTSIPAIRLTGITRRYSSDSSPLTNASLRIDAGEFVAVTGPSGSGKSTLLNILGLLDRPNSGSYLLDGVETQRLGDSERDKLRSSALGFVFQASYGLPGRTVAANVQLPLELAGVRLQDQPAAIATQLRRVGLEHKANTMFDRLSGGEKQRVAIARGLVRSPLLLLLDEPTGNLDPENTRRIVDLLKSLNETGTTIVLVTHDVDVARAADRIVTLQEGKVAETATEARDARTPNVATSKPHRRTPWSRLLSALLTDALYGVTYRPWRTALLVLTVAFGSAGLVLANGLSVTASQQVDSAIRDASNNVVRAHIADKSHPAADFSLRDVETASSIQGVISAGVVWSVPPLEGGVTRVFSARTNRNASLGSDSIGVLAIEGNTLEVLGATMSPRTSVHLLRATAGEPLAMIGRSAADRLGITGAGANQSIWINNKTFSVAGIVESAAESASILDNCVLLSKQTSERLTGSLPPGQLLLKTTPGMSGNVAGVLPLSLSPNAPSRIEIETVADLRRLRVEVNTQLAQFGNAVVVSLLGLSIVVTAATLSAAAAQRRGEIGLRRSLGSSTKQIAGLFVLEGALAGALGGLTGGALGIVAILVASVSRGWTPVADPLLLLLGLLVGASIGASAAVVAALRSAKVDPAEALRG